MDVSMVEMYKGAGIDITADYGKFVEEVVNNCEICHF